MARVGLLIPCFTEADAVSNDVRGMHAALRRRGHDVRVFASHSEVRELPSWPLGAARRFLRQDGDVFIYHHSTGWQEGVEALAAARCRRVLKYQNVTPAEFFEGIDQEYVLSCRAGRRQLAAFARAGCDRYLADSPYNLGELLAAGAPSAAGAVVPPFHNIDRLMALATDATAERCRDGRTNVLVVGRIVPNKGHTAVLEAFALYRRRYDPASRLVIVGKEDPRLAVYTEALHGRVADLGLADAVVFTGGVSDAALKTYYQVAKVFVIASAHEGFCVPLVEAMALGVPVVALGATAVPDTVAGAGLVWEEPDADLLAESIHAVVTDEAARGALARCGRRRYADHFSNAAIARKFVSALDGLL